MSHIEIHLPTKEEEESPSIYVNKKLVPLAAELYRLVQINTSADRSKEKEESDMTCQEITKQYTDVNVMKVENEPKSVEFSVDSKVPREKNGKILKILFTLVAYSADGKPVAFRLFRKSDGNFVDNSVIQVDSTYPHTYVAHLPFGDGKNSIRSAPDTYILQARYIGQVATPVARRFSLSMVYA